MVSDSITADIRAIRQKLAAEFNNDLDRILADLRERETQDSRCYVTLPPRRITPRSDQPSVAPKSPSPPISPGHSNSATG